MFLIARDQQDAIKSGEKVNMKAKAMKKTKTRMEKEKEKETKTMTIVFCAHRDRHAACEACLQEWAQAVVDDGKGITEVLCLCKFFKKKKDKEK